MKNKDYDRVARLGCILCWHLGYDTDDVQPELHHIRTGNMPRKMCPVIGLCREHHRGNTGLHGLGTKGFQKHYGYDEADLLNDTHKLLGVADEQH
jgi:hypothetical protein